MIVGIIGTGVMGGGIVQLFLSNGFKVILKSRKKKAVGKIKTTTDFKELSSADFIIEAVPEDIAIKEKVLRKLNEVCGKEVVIVSNTSSIPITRLGRALDNPSRFAGMHFFNPVDKMNLVEVVRGEETSDETVRKVCKIAEAVDKTPIVVKDSPGFIVNRLLLPFLNDSVLLLEKGVGSPEDIDTAVRMGLNHPMGPFRLLDLIGLDTFARAMQNMGMEPAQRIQNMISKGKLGRKTGEGFYRYR